MKQLIDKLKANFTFLVMQTHEEARAELEIIHAAKDTNRKLFAWSMTNGVKEMDLKTGAWLSLNKCEGNPQEAAKFLASPATGKAAIVVLTDFAPYLKDPVLVRMLRDALYKCRDRFTTVIFLAPDITIPVDLERDASHVEFPLPDETAIKTVIEAVIACNDQVKAPDEATMIKAIEAAKGLTSTEIENACALSIVEHRAINAAVIAKEKAAMIGKGGALEVLAPPPGGLSDVGGMDGVKDWIRTRGEAFSPKARAYGLPFPKGLLIPGVQGTGKSLVAKAAAKALDLPLIRLDVGSLFAGLVGESEANTRRAIATIDAIAPAVVMIDEMEKAFAGAQAARATDSGVSSRVLGMFLTWLQDHKSPVFLIATANDVTALPPEMIRKGRWDNMLFCDLPDEQDRRAILDIHLTKRGRDPKKFDVEALAQMSEGFSGAELEQAIVDAMFAAFSEKGREFVTKDVGNAIGTSVPLSKTMAEKINDLREWAQTRCVPASGKKVKVTTAAKMGRSVAS